MRVCAVSGKRTVTGNKVSHSNRTTKRVWKPNLQRVTIMVDGVKKKIRVSTRYMKMLKRA